jgi:peptidoglycan/xylan/chitin deacetylase (PgdA/CDA1 family)
VTVGPTVGIVKPQRRAAVVVLTVALVALTLTLGVMLRDHHATTTATATSTSTATTATSTTAPSASSTTTSSTSSTTTASTTTTTPAGPAIVIRRGDPTKPLVALTFDAGSDLGHASTILDTLAAYGVRATFGMTGAWAEAHPAVVARMVREGHQLVNHSYDHPSFTGRSTGAAPLSRQERIDQLQRAESAIVAATGVSPRPWFRPPYGDEDASVRADVALAGYRYELMWTVDTLGWNGLDVDGIVSRCLEGAENGAIYLLHVGSASADSDALPRIIEGLRAMGYGFATADAMAAG